MAWARLDDGFFDHPKLRSVSVAAGYLWVCSIAYCARHRTDGLISEDAAELLISPRKAGCSFEGMRDDLVEAGLWDRDGGASIRVHDYLQYNPSREQVAAERAATARRMRAMRNRRRSDAPCDAVTPPVTPTVTDAVGDAPCDTAPYPFKRREEASSLKQSENEKQANKLSTWLSTEQAEELKTVLSDLVQAHPARYLEIEQLVACERRKRSPPEPLIAAMRQALKHKPDDPAGYIAKILKIEIGNWHAHQAEAKHAAIKETEARERASPTVTVDKEEPTPVSQSVTSMLQGLMKRAKGAGQVCPEEVAG